MSATQRVLLALLTAALPLAGNALDATGASVPGTAAAPTNDWITWGHDPERSGWNRGETRLTKQNAPHLKLLWSSLLSTLPTDVALSTLTAPLVVSGVSTAGGVRNLVVLLGADNTLFALDADSGGVIWQKTHSNTATPERAANWLCPHTANATPVIDRANGIVYFITSDGKLRGVNLGDGAERLPPTDMVAPFARAWSLNLIDGIVYTTSGRACGEVLDRGSTMAAATTWVGGPNPVNQYNSATADPSAVSAMDVRDPAHPRLNRFYTSGARAAAPWGRGSTARGPKNTVILETSDGLYDPAAGQFGDSILMLAPMATRLLDSFTPKNHKLLAAKDLGGSASPIVFPFGDRTLVAVSQKEAVVYLLDAADLGGGPPENHALPLYQSPQLGNEALKSTDPGQGVWGSMATWESPDHRRFLYVPMHGPPASTTPVFKYGNGPTPNGSIMAFQVVANGDTISLEPQWSSPDLIMPDPPVVANGVVYALSTGGQALQNTPMPDGTPRDPTTNGARYRATPVSNLILYALDAENGKLLYSSKQIITDWVHFSEPVVALGKVFVVTHDAHVYAFGVK
jgi:outer membrane protein assembly factor BamB